MTASNDLVPASTHRSGIPIARMRSLYRIDEVGRKLDKLPQKEHEGLRSTYERMLEKGPERFQVKPSGLPVMDHLYDDLPNFAEVLDDIKRSSRCAKTAAMRSRSRRCCCSARPVWARPISHASCRCCSAPAWVSCR